MGAILTVLVIVGVIFAGIAAFREVPSASPTPTPTPSPPVPLAGHTLHGNGDNAGDSATSAGSVPPANHINAKLTLEKIYFFYDSDMDLSQNVPYKGATTPAVYFLNRVRHDASPDPSAGERHVVNAVMLVTPPHPMAFAPRLDLTATEFGEEASLFFGTTESYEMATLRHAGCLSGDCAVHVLVGKVTAPEREGVYRLGWTDGLSGQKRHGAAPSVPLGPREALLDVTCDDQIFCNGPEHFIRGECVSMNTDPCIFDALNPCLQHECLEADGICSSDSLGARAGMDCSTCGPFCEPKCSNGRKCGSGGCNACTEWSSENPLEWVPYGCTPPDFCGSCADGETCSYGSCVVEEQSSTPGSCNAPYKMMQSYTGNDGDKTSVIHAGGNALPADGVTVPAGGTLFRVETPTIAYMEDNVTPPCGNDAITEHVYEFTIDLPAGSTGQGVEFMVIPANYDLGQTNPTERFVNVNIALDPLLSVHRAGCAPLDFAGAAYATCSDDSVPPGSYLPHIYTRLPSGTYNLVMTWYGEQFAGPYVITAKFTDAASTCFPQCDGAFCGSDECQIHIEGEATPTPSICGLEQFFGLSECNTGESCISGRCTNCELDFITGPNYISECGPDGQCGYDQCNQPCNKKEATTGEPACEKGVKACDFQNHKCVSVGECDNYSPECQGKKNGRNEARFCGSDCALYRTYDDLPDLAPESQYKISKSIVFDRRVFQANSCAVVEDCLGPITDEMLAAGSFELPLMRFDTNIINLGNGFKPPGFDEAPQIFEYSKCHGHNHFDGFASFNLLDIDDVTTVQELDTAVLGGKLAYCMEDSIPYLENGQVLCEANNVCDDQGLQYGWIDKYPADLDCQWVVLREFFEANRGGEWVTYQVCTNFGRVFMEKTFNNNCRSFPVYVPIAANIPVTGTLSYTDFMAANQHLCNELPAELPVGVEWPVVCPQL